MQEVPTIARRLVGGLFIATAGMHVGIVAADAEFYRPFADAALVPGIRTAWSNIFMAHPAAWGLAVAAGELAIGITSLAGGRWARLGVGGAIAFHVALMLFGWGFWFWSLPMLALLAAILPAQQPHARQPAGRRRRRATGSRARRRGSW